jgi:tRNA(Arg) A34 adenosine deaminase TadA
LNARLGEVVWGAPNPLIGGDGSWLPIMGDGGGAVVAEADVDEPEDAVRSCSIPGGGGPVRPHAFKPTLVVRRRVLEEECAALMRSFFRERRDASKAAREVARAEAEDADPPRTSS